MKFYRLGEIPVRSDDQVFKVPAWGSLAWCLGFWGMAIGLFWFGTAGAMKHGLGPPIFFSYVFAAGLALFARLSYSQFRACLKPTNWLLRCNSDGVVIKFRSFWNWKFPAGDAQAVGLDYCEIAWVRTVREVRISPSADAHYRTQRQRITYLDFCLAKTDTAALEAHLQAEQKAKFQGRWSTTVVLDYPVELLPGGIIQLRWSKSGQFAVKPSPAKAIEYLSRHVKIAPADSTKMDLTHRPGPSPGEEDAKILKLARSGDRMGAVTLAQQVYGSSLTEAVAFVDKLQSGN